MPRKKRDRSASALAERRAAAVRELLSGARDRDVAKRHGITVPTLVRWRADFLAAGQGALTPHDEQRQRWTREGPGRRPKKAGRTMLEQLHIRCSKRLKARLATYAQRRTAETGDLWSVPDAAREILERALD